MASAALTRSDHRPSGIDQKTTAALLFSFCKELSQAGFFPEPGYAPDNGFLAIDLHPVHEGDAMAGYATQLRVNPEGGVLLRRYHGGTVNSWEQRLDFERETVFAPGDFLGISALLLQRAKEMHPSYGDVFADTGTLAVMDIKGQQASVRLVNFNIQNIQQARLLPVTGMFADAVNEGYKKRQEELADEREFEQKRDEAFNVLRDAALQLAPVFKVLRQFPGCADDFEDLAAGDVSAFMPFFKTNRDSYDRGSTFSFKYDQSKKPCYVALEDNRRRSFSLKFTDFRLYQVSTKPYLKIGSVTCVANSTNFQIVFRDKLREMAHEDETGKDQDKIRRLAEKAEIAIHTVFGQNPAPFVFNASRELPALPAPTPQLSWLQRVTLALRR